MGTITRALVISQTPNLEGNWAIPYSRLLLGNPLDYNTSIVGTRRCPMIQGKYTYSDDDISSANVSSVVGTTWQVVMTVWDIDAVGGARIGDTITIGSGAGTVIGTITEVIETATSLTLKVGNPQTSPVGTNSTYNLWPRNRGNFGPITVNVQNSYVGSDFNFDYQPPITADPTTSDNFFTVDASEALKTAFAAYQGQPFSDSLEDYRLTLGIQLRMDGALEDSWSLDNVLDGTVAYGVPPITYNPISNVCLPRFGPDPTNPLVRMRWSVSGEEDVWVQPYLIDNDGIPLLPTGSSFTSQLNEITCADYDFLAVGLHYIQLVWLNPYGGFDTWLFPYGEPGPYGGNTPRHNYTAGKSQMARRDFDITQVNRGIQQQNFEFNSGMVAREFVPVLEGLHGSPLVFMLPIGVPMATTYDNTTERYSFSLIDQPELIRVILEDQDWQDSLIGYPATSFSATVVIANITNTQTL